MINFVQHVHTARPKERPEDDRAMIPRTSSDHLAVTRWGMKIGRWPCGHPQASVRRPAGEQPVSVRPAAFFSSLLEPKFRMVAHGPPSGDRQMPRGRPTDEWICVTSSDHPPNFSCKFKCSGRRPTSQGWALQECLFGRSSPDFSLMGSKWGAKLAVRSPPNRFFSVGTSALYLSVCYKVLSDLFCWEWSPTFSVFVVQRNRQFQLAAMFVADCILIGQLFWTWIGMQVQVWYLTLSTVKPIKLITSAC